MRTFAALFLLAALAGGCGDDSTSSTMNGDLSAGGDDLAVPADMTQLSCSGILSCIAGCGQNLACQGDCRDSGTTMAKSGYDALAGCTAATCAPGDAGTGACTSATDMRASCLTCLANAAAAAINPGNVCFTQYTTCASD